MAKTLLLREALMKCKCITFLTYNGGPLIAADEKIDLGWRRNQKIRFAFHSDYAPNLGYGTLTVGKRWPQTRQELFDLLSILMDEAAEQQPQMTADHPWFPNDAIIRGLLYDPAVFGDDVWVCEIERDSFANMPIAGHA